MNPATSQPECLRTDLTYWEIGPYHGSLPGPMRLRLTMDGEIVVAAEVETGFLHRGLEKAMQSQPWVAAVVYADHLDPEAAIFGELVVCQAVEEIASLDVPERAAGIRVILSELSRISSHLLYLVHIARSVGAETLIHYVLRDRERLLDLFELLTGARFSLSFLRFGGVRADVTEGFIERVIELCELIRVRVKEYNDLFTFNHTFLNRTARVGRLSPDLVARSGITGPNARASGARMDVRRDHPYLTYKGLDFVVPQGPESGERGGDAHDRFLIRLREITESLGILRHVAETIPRGPYMGAGLPSESGQAVIPPGEAYSRVESARGLLGCHVISDGGPRPGRVQFRVPTLAALAAVPEILHGTRLEDLPIVLASLDLSIAEADR